MCDYVYDKFLVQRTPHKARYRQLILSKGSKSVGAADQTL